MQRVRVAIEAVDAMSKAGLARYFEFRCMLVLPDAQRAEADVVVMATPRLSQHAVSALRDVASAIGVPVVLLVNRIAEGDVRTLIDCDVAAILRRSAVIDDSLLRCVQDVVGEKGVSRSERSHRLMRHVRRLQREVVAAPDMSVHSLTGRELNVLGLVAEGLGTTEIARELCYSERTVKNVIYAIMSRLQLRNRAHVVAYALRAGMLDGPEGQLASTLITQ